MSYNSILMFTKIFFAFLCVFSSHYHQQMSETSHQNFVRRSIILFNPKQSFVSVNKDSHYFIKNTLQHLVSFCHLKPTYHICEQEFYKQSHVSKISLKCMDKHEKMMYLKVLYELPDDNSLGMEICSNVECHLLN